MKKTNAPQTKVTDSAVMPERKRTPRKAKIMKAEAEPEMYEETITEVETMPKKSQSLSGRLGLIGLMIVALLGFGAYKYRHLLTPAVVNGQPIYVWDYFWKLNTQFGKDQLNSMTTEMVITQAVAKANVTVSNSDVDAQLADIEKQASSSGGLQAVLDAQHLTMAQFRDRIQLQLAVKKILAAKIAVTDQEVNDDYAKNKDFYKAMSEADAKTQIRQQLEDQKFQTEASSWLADVRKNAKIEINFPGL